jgi:hypothetical protein
MRKPPAGFMHGFRTGEQMKDAALLRGVSRINVWQSFEMSETFAKARASRNIIETVSLSQRNHLHVNVCAPVAAGDQWAAGAATHAEWSLVHGSPDHERILI